MMADAIVWAYGQMRLSGRVSRTLKERVCTYHEERVAITAKHPVGEGEAVAGEDEDHEREDALRDADEEEELRDRDDMSCFSSHHEWIDSKAWVILRDLICKRSFFNN